jgi:FCP1-like phosphatase family protein
MSTNIPRSSDTPRFIARLCSQITLKPSPVSPADFPNLDWGLAEAGNIVTKKAGEEERETQVGFYDLQIPCATTNARHDRKLSLVLDLDQTLVHAVKLNELFSETLSGPLRSEAETFIANNLLTTDNPHYINSFATRIDFLGTICEPEARQLLATRLDSEMYLIKLRPGLRQFLHDLADMYELHIYTKANRNYLNFLMYELDPLGKLFMSAVARDDSPDLDTDLKIINRVCCRDMAEVVVFDDRVDVWSETPLNVVKAQPYNFLSQRKTAVVKAIEELVNTDNRKTSVFDYDGHLYAMKDALIRIFNEYSNQSGTIRPVPDVITRVRKDVLRGVRLQFTGFPDVQAHIKDAEEYGAVCSAIEDTTDEPSILIAAKHTKRVYDLTKTSSKNSGPRIVHWSWMDHVRSTWQQPSLSVFDLHKFRVDGSGVYPPMDDWEVVWLSANSDPKGSDKGTNVSSKRRRDND